MKYIISNEEVLKVTEAMSVVAGKDFTVLLEMGKSVQGEDIVCYASALAGTEQIKMSFLATKPAGFEKSETVAFDGKMFLTVVNSLLSFKEAVALETAPAMCCMEVSSKARLPIAPVAEDKIPEQIVMDKSNLLIHVKAKQEEFVSALRQGGYMAKNNTDQNGMDFSVFSFNENTLDVYSTDGYGIAKGSTACKVAPDAEAAQRREEFIKGKGFEKLIVAVPKKAVMNIIKFLTGTVDVVMSVSDRHIFVATGKNILYSATLGAKPFAMVFTADKWLLQDAQAEVVVDNTEFSTAVKALQQVIDITAADKKPLLVTLTNDEIRLEQANLEGVMRIKTIEGNVPGGEMRLAFSGKKMLDVLGSLEKGNLKVTFYAEKQPALFSNGALGTTPESGFTFLLPINIKKEDEATAEAEEETSEETEETSEE